jgi:hypothetical protein
VNGEIVSPAKLSEGQEEQIANGPISSDQLCSDLVSLEGVQIDDRKIDAV